HAQTGNKYGQKCNETQDRSHIAQPLVYLDELIVKKIIFERMDRVNTFPCVFQLCQGTCEVIRSYFYIEVTKMLRLISEHQRPDFGFHDGSLKVKIFHHANHLHRSEIGLQTLSYYFSRKLITQCFYSCLVHQNVLVSC